MKKLFRKILSLLMSILMSIGIPATNTQLTEFPSNADNDSIVGLPLNNWPNLEFTDEDREPDGSISDETYSKKMVEWWNGTVEHDYLAFYMPDGNKKELAVRGLKALYFDTSYNYFVFVKVDRVVIPDEIDGIPVVSIDEEAFCNGEDDNIDKIETVIVGNNITKISHRAFGGRDFVIIGKNQTEDFSPFSLEGVSVLYCYKNSPIYLNLHKDMYGYPLSYSFIDESHLKSEVADIDENGNIKGLPTGLTNETVKDYLAVDGDAMMEVSDEVVGTGTTVKLINSEYSTIDNTYTVILDGDINGDGNVNTAEDASAMRKIISGDDSAFSEADRLAADINGDGLVNSTDLILMKTSQN